MFLFNKTMCSFVIYTLFEPIIIALSSLYVILKVIAHLGLFLKITSLSITNPRLVKIFQSYVILVSHSYILSLRIS